MQSESDHGLAVLEDVLNERDRANTENSTVTIELLHRCYRVSHNHRYESEQDVMRREIEKLVEAFVDDPARTEEAP